MKRGLTLVELLALLFVLGLMIVLLLPATFTSHVNSWRAACTNYQKQLCLELMNYESSHKEFPGYKQDLAGNAASWVVMLLPYIDCNDLWSKWNAGTPEKEYLPVMVCPSDPSKITSPLDGPSSYVVNTKVCMDGKGLALDYISTKDGSAVTLLTGENLRIDKAHSWWDTDPIKVGFSTGKIADNLRSNHAGGAVVTFCDGHSAFFRDDIGESVFNALVTPDGGEKLDESLVP